MELSKKEKIEKICNALDDEDFQVNLVGIRDKIESEIKKFLLTFKSNHSDIKVSEAIESRIKSSKSLAEKLERKNYINKWNISNDQVKNKKTLMENLPDLIGLRIICFFRDDEKKLFDELKKYDFKHLELTDDSKTNDKTGYSLYKCTGTYYDGAASNYNFEIQVKSTMISLWSEVQHDTVYKKEGYDVNYSLKQKITDDLFKKISASDSSLKTIYTEKYTEEDLIKALFCEQTKYKIDNSHEVGFLGQHYETFFKVMGNILKKGKILEKFCGSCLLGTTFKKSKYDIRELTENEKQLSNILKNEYYPFYFEVFESIFLCLFEMPEGCSIFDIIAKQIVDPFGIDDEDEEENVDGTKITSSNPIESYKMTADLYFKG